MPRLQINYENAVVYKLCCKDVNITNIYVGSTTNFRTRKNAHKGNCNRETNKSYNAYVYVFIRENGGWDNWDMIEIEKTNCDDANELRRRERYYVELMGADLNSVMPIRTKEENLHRHKEYILINRTAVLAQARQNAVKYRENNAEHFKHLLEHYVCDCGSSVSNQHKQRHNNSKKHQTFLLNNI